MNLKDLEKRLEANGFKYQITPRDNQEYTLYQWSKGHLSLILEEAHSYNLTGKVNMIYLIGRVSAPISYETLDSVFNLGRLSGVMGLNKDNTFRFKYHPIGGFDSLIPIANKIISEFPLTSGIAHGWDNTSTALDYFDITV